MTDRPSLPTMNDLTEHKVNVKVWTPPTVKAKLQDMAKTAGQPLSKFTSGILAGVAFPELAGEPILKFAQPEPAPERGDGDAPRFDSVAQLEQWLVDQGLVSNPEDARAVSALAVEFLNKPAAGGN